MTSVCPVNQLLGFGIRGMTPSDVILLPWLMWICQKLLAEQISSCSTHSVSCIERAVADGNVMSVFKDVCPAHSEWLKMSVRDQDEEGKEKRLMLAGNPQSCHEVLIYFYIDTSMCLSLA